MDNLYIDDLRSVLIRQEETIIFSLIERAQFRRNLIIYEPKGIPVKGFNASFCGYLLWETEKIHARVRRYTSPEEHPFFDNLPTPILPDIEQRQRIRPTTLNINPEIFNVYRREIIPRICCEGDDGHYGSSATGDVICLQALSKRIHYGKFVAEAKFQSQPDAYTTLIKKGDQSGLMNRLTDRAVEEKLLKRVEHKAATYGQDIDVETDHPLTFKIDPQTIRLIYERWVIPLTKKVEVGYLLQRLS